MKNNTVSVTIKRSPRSCMSSGVNTISKLTGLAVIYTEDNNIIGQKSGPGHRVGDTLTDAQVDEVCKRYENVAIILES